VRGALRGTRMCFAPFVTGFTSLRPRSLSATGRPGPDRFLRQLRISSAGELLQNEASEI